MVPPPAPSPSAPDADIDLSPRQRQILSLLRAGASNKDIAADLNIGVGTVKQHLVVLFRKLGVTSRTAAISRSLTLGGLGKTGLETVASDMTSPSTTLERRPVAVLSLRVAMSEPTGTADDRALRKRIHQAFSDVAFDFGAVFLTHEGGRCNMIFGIRQARRHDAMRAVRAAFAVHDRLHRGHDGRAHIQAAVACGTVSVSTDISGAWSGDTLSGTVITRAHALAKTAPPDTVALDGTARGMIAYLDRGTPDGMPTTVAIDAPFQWQTRQPNQPTLFGRVREQEALRSRLYKLRGGSGGVIRLTGETGMGKSTLLADFRGFAAAEGLSVQRYGAAIPDSQPHLTALGRLEPLDGDHTLLTPADFADHSTAPARSTAHIIMIDDAHLLGAEAAGQVAAILKSQSSPVSLVILAHRGPDPFGKTPLATAETIPLARIDTDAMQSIATSLVDADRPYLDWAVETAAGVPGFLVQICQYLETVAPETGTGDHLMPPLTLFSMISERLEGLGLDRHLLQILAHRGTPCPKADAIASWTGAGDGSDAITRMVSAGVIDMDAAQTLTFRHPLVGWVAKHMTEPWDAST